MLQPRRAARPLCLPHLERSSPAGRIVAITSLAAKEPTAQLALSNTLRPASRLAEDARRELGPSGITVNCVAPGRIATERLDSSTPTARPTSSSRRSRFGRWGAGGVRRRRLLPRLRPRALRHRPDDRRRRRAERSLSSAPAQLTAAAAARRRLVAARSSRRRPLPGPVERLYASCRTRRTRWRRSSRCKGGNDPTGPEASSSSTSSSAARACFERSSRGSTRARRSCRRS